MSGASIQLYFVPCLLCCGQDGGGWGDENGFSCVKCSGCGLVYVNPRPGDEDISQANEIGEHRTGGATLRVVFKRSRRKAMRYATTMRYVFPDLDGSPPPARRPAAG